MIIKETLREQVVKHLRKKIVSGEIKPGERVIESEISRELQVSRGPIREALRQLEEEGIVTYESHKGCVVKTVGYEEMLENTLIRGTLEILAVKTSGGVLREETKIELKHIIEEIDQAAKDRKLYEMVMADEEFHSTVVRASGREKIWKVWKMLEGGNSGTFYTMHTNDLMPYDFVAYNHRKILEVFETGDLDAICKKIEEHYNMSVEPFRNLVKTSSEDSK